jgi:hypothetical protein
VFKSVVQLELGESSRETRPERASSWGYGWWPVHTLKVRSLDLILWAAGSHSKQENIYCPSVYGKPPPWLQQGEWVEGGRNASRETNEEAAAAVGASNDSGLDQDAAVERGSRGLVNVAEQGAG